MRRRREDSPVDDRVNRPAFCGCYRGARAPAPTAYPSPTTSSTTFGFRSITRSSTLAAGSGWRRPCSQPSRVRTGMPKRREKSSEVFATRFRIAFTR
jgi:hypothetical protein